MKIFYTSYFGNKQLKEINKNLLFCIARGNPINAREEVKDLLQPSSSLLYRYKGRLIDWPQYVREYTDYLEKNKDKIIARLKELEEGSIFLCYEKNYPCHRYILAEFLTMTGEFIVNEL